MPTHIRKVINGAVVVEALKWKLPIDAADKLEGKEVYVDIYGNVEAISIHYPRPYNFVCRIPRGSTL